MLGPGNVWVFGASTSVNGGVFHWTGSRWHAYDVNSLNLIPQSLGGTAGNDWLAGVTWARV